MQNILELKNVSKTFILESGKELKVLDKIDIRLGSNEVVALLGPSGSGKSTCLRIMCGLQTASDGEVLNQGQPLLGINDNVSMVFQSFALFPWETIKRNIEIALHPLELSAEDLQKRVKDAIDLVGLEGFEEAYPRELSGGMKQRVGIARALAMERPVLFLDEPFSALDVLTADTLREEIMKIFLSRKTKTGSMVVVTHNIQEAVIMAQRILVMGSNPGHVRAEFHNRLPYPRIADTAPFNDLVNRIHGSITETYIPDAPSAGFDVEGQKSKGPGLEILPNVYMMEIIGLLEAIDAEGGAEDVFVLSKDIGKDFGQTLYLVKSAELLGMVETPKQQVILTKIGQAFVKSDVNLRKKMLHEQFAKLLIVEKATQFLKRSPTVRRPVDEMTEKISQWLPNEDPHKILETLIGWGRYAEYFGYNDNTKEIYLDVGQEV
ncbi:MAG: nitrate/sulfonate/bicarbonate ABC transporter ATP-binding protein [Pseudobdellovibrionaceae bacterium]